MPELITLCVDPGVGGGVVTASGSSIIQVAPMPENEEAIVAFLRAQVPKGKDGRVRLFIEQVSGYIGEEHPGAFMFTFGENFGLIKGWAHGIGIRPQLVGPMMWQQRLRLGLRSERKDKAEWKRHLRAEALRRFPEWKPTLKTADALLLWDFVRVHRPWRSQTVVEV